MSVKPERKLWHELKKYTPKISWTRIENTGSFGTPDLLGYNSRGHFFTLELKATKTNKVRFSPHQFAFHMIAKVLAPGVTLSRAQVIRMLVEEKVKKLNGKLTKSVSKSR